MLDYKTEGKSFNHKMKKYADLLQSLKKYYVIAVAYSGGIDSTLLLRAAVDSGKDNKTKRVLALHGHSELMSKSATLQMRRTIHDNFSSTEQVELVEVSFDPLRWDGFAQNRTDRCYVCKKNLYIMLKTVAENCGADVFCDGTNADDLHKDRPGLAALAELNVCKPLAEYGFSKKDVRQQAAKMNLTNADLPANSCLATRIAFDCAITPSLLNVVEKAESFLLQRGFVDYRLRIEENQLTVKLIYDGEVVASQVSFDKDQQHAIMQRVYNVLEKWTLFLRQ